MVRALTTSHARLEVVGLSGRTGWVSLPSGGRVASLRDEVAAHEGVAPEEVRLVQSCRDLADGEALCCDAAAPPVRAMLRVLGGKGGFGAMLRLSGRSGVKTTNFDACRDLNGRRLRHVNAEQQLREWESQAEVRKMKAQQEKADKAIEANAKKANIPRFDDDEYEDMLEAKRNSVSDAFAAATAVTGAASSGGGSSTSPLLEACGESSAPVSSKAEGKKRMAPASDTASTPKAPRVEAKAKVWADPLALMGADGSGESSDEEVGCATST